MAEAYRALTLTIRLLSFCLIFFSALNALTGAALVGIGIFILVDLSPDHGGNLIMVFTSMHGSKARSGIYKAATVMIISGVVIMLYGVTAVIALWRKSYRNLCMYIGLLVICIICEATTGFYAVRFQQEVDAVLEVFLLWTIKEKYMGLKHSNEFFTAAWDYVQKEYTCCGVNNGTDWVIAETWERNVTVVESSGKYVPINLTTPVSCCRLLTKSQIRTKWFGQILTKAERFSLREPDITVVYDQPCVQEPTTYNSYIGEGCRSSVAIHLLQYNAAIVSGALVVILIQIAGILLTIILHKLAKDLRIRGGNKYRSQSDDKRISSNKKLYPREVRRRYAYFDDDFDDRWESAL